MLNIVGRREPVPIGLLLSELSLVLNSYWGQFSCSFFDSQLYYSAWTIVSLLGLLGLGLGLRRSVTHHPFGFAQGKVSRFTLYLLLAWFLLVFIAGCAGTSLRLPRWTIAFFRSQFNIHSASFRPD